MADKVIDNGADGREDNFMDRPPRGQLHFGVTDWLLFAAVAAATLAVGVYHGAAECSAAAGNGGGGGGGNRRRRLSSAGPSTGNGVPEHRRQPTFFLQRKGIGSDFAFLFVSYTSFAVVMGENMYKLFPSYKCIQFSVQISLTVRNAVLICPFLQ